MTEELRNKKFKINDFVYDERNQPIFEKPQNVVDLLLNQLNPLLNKEEVLKDEFDHFIKYAKDLATSINPIFIKDIILISIIRDHESEVISEIKFIGKLRNLLLSDSVEEIELNNKELSILEKLIPSLKLKTHIKYQLLKCFDLVD